MTESTPTPTPDTHPQPRGKKPLVAGAAAGAAVVLIGGGAFAFTQLSGGGTQPHDVLPSTTQAYVRVDLDPSAGQKVALFKLLRKVPDAKKEIGDAETFDIRREVFKQISSGCPDLDYAKDVEPWLGQRIGVGADLKDETFVVAAQVQDEDDARAGVDKIADCSGQEIGLAFVDGYALMSDSQKTVDAAVEATQKKSLGDSKEFADDMEAIGEQGIASLWVDGKAAADALADVPGANAQLGNLKDLEKVGGVAAALRVDGSAIELAGTADDPDTTKTEPVPLGTLPDDTVFALGFSGLGPELSKNYDQLKTDFVAGFEGTLGTSADGSVDEFLDQIEQQTGLTLPDDAATLLGDSFTLSVGQKGLERLPELQSPTDIEAVDMAVRTRTDPAAAKATFDKLAALGQQAGLQLVVQPTDDGAVLASNADAAQAVQSAGKLGDQPAYASVMPFGDRTTSGAYLDVAAVIDAVKRSGATEDAAELEQAEAIRSIGLSGGKVGDGRVGFSLRVGFSD